MESDILLGFTGKDLFISVTCMTIGAFGALADYVLKRDDLVNLPKEELNPMKWSRWLPLLLGRTFIGILAGFTIWIIMIGSMVDGKEAIAKLWLLSGLAGFIAPSIAVKYNKKLDKYIENQIDEKS